MIPSNNSAACSVCFGSGFDVAGRPCPFAPHRDAATLKAAQGGVTEATPNDDAGHEWAKKHHLFVYEVDFGDEGKGRYIRLGDFNKVVAALEAALSAEPAAQGERMPVPFYVGRNHPNQAYVTLGFDSEDACDRFYKAITRGKGLYTAPPAQPAEVEATLRRILERGKHRTDGDLVTLLDRVEHMTRGDQDLIAMQRTENRLLDEKSAQPADRVPEGWRKTLLAVVSALDAATGDSDPNLDPDMTDDEVRDEYPEVWAMQQITALLASPAPSEGGKWVEG